MSKMMKNDPELEAKLIGMNKDDLLDFFEATIIETHTVISYNDRIPEGETCEPVEKAKAKLEQVRAYMLKRMSH